jgi:hypothetical protein
LRRTFRDVAEVFRNNPRLQQTGEHLWVWFLMNYVSSVLIRIRRQIDSQNNTVNLKQLMHAIIKHPQVVTRGRRNAMNKPIAPTEFLAATLDREFNETWVPHVDRESRDPSDCIDPAIVQQDLDTLESALKKVELFAHTVIAHRVRFPPLGAPTFEDIDLAFDAIEEALKKNALLISGVALLQAEPAPQFNTHEVFTFPWIE